MGIASPKPSFLKTDKGMGFMLAPRSHKAFSKWLFPIVHGIEKFPESFNLGGSLFNRIALHSLLSIIVSWSSSFFLFLKMFFMNFPYFGICVKAYAKGMLMCNFLNILTNWENCLYVFRSLWGNRTSGTYGFTGAFFTDSGSGATSSSGQRFNHADSGSAIC